MREEHGLGLGVRESWRRCEVAATALNLALVQELRCDDFRRIPRGGAARLQPVMQLLLRFPDQAERATVHATGRRQVAGLVLRRMLADLGDSREEAQLLDRLRRCGSWSEGVRAIRAARVETGLTRFTQENATTQARPAQLLYWLLRRPGSTGRGARDFDYAANDVLHGQQVREVRRGDHPECQHMLPVSKVASILHPDRSARGAGPTSSTVPR